MKNSFNSPLSEKGAACGLCQDTLLRHIRQSRVFWYCPSCRQEMVCKEPETSATDTIATTNMGQLTHQHCTSPTAAHYNRPVGVRAS